MQQKDLLTIIIPTFKRPTYLKRLLGYYSESHLKYPIVIADGSPEEVKTTNREVISSFPALRVHYVEGYTPETRFNDKLLNALTHVHTRYCVVCADDDFITPKGIEQSVDFLESNTDYSVAHGQYLFFTMEGESSQIQLRWTTVYQNESIISDNPVLRVKKHLATYLISPPTFYAVHQTFFLRWVLEESFRNTESTDVLFSELLSTAITLLYGKMKCLDVLYSVKDNNQNRTGRIKDFRDYKEEGTYEDQYVRFRKILADHLISKSKIGLIKAKNTIDDAMAVYMKMIYPPEPKQSFWAPMTETVGRTMNRLHYHGRFRKWLGVLSTRSGVYLERKKVKPVVAEPIQDDRPSLLRLLQNDEDVKRIKFQILSSAKPFTDK